MNAGHPIDDVLLRAGEVLAVAHHVPGRIRLKLVDDRAAAAVLAGTRFPEPARLAAVAGVRAVRPNLLARSCVVEYDPAVLPPAAWTDLLAGVRTEACELLLHSLAGAVSDRAA